MSRRSSSSAAPELPAGVRRSSRATAPRIDPALLLDFFDEGEDDFVSNPPPPKRRKKANQRMSTTEDSTSPSSPTDDADFPSPSNTRRKIRSNNSTSPLSTPHVARQTRRTRNVRADENVTDKNGTDNSVDDSQHGLQKSIPRSQRSKCTTSRKTDESLSSRESDDVETSSVVESTTHLSTDEGICETVPEDKIWENVGETKDDDDRVVQEVHKRYELAKSLRINATTESIGTTTLLEELLDQSDKYTGYMLARSLAVPDEQTMSQNRMSQNRMSQNRMAQARGPKRAHRRKDREEELLLKEADEELAGNQRFWTRLSEQPKSISGGVMKPYQLEGLNWLIHLYESGLNGILADEMGLGKTLQTISLLAYLKESRNIRGPHLVLAPKSTLGNWLNEIKRFAPSLKAYRFHGTKEERQQARNRGDLDPQKHDIFITSYELCIKEQCLFRKFNFRYIVVDEAHRIKNEASKLSKIIRTFPTQFRLLLTGTPLQNNLRELWSLLNFLFPEMFASSEEFDRMFDLTGAFDDAKFLTPGEKTVRNSAIVSRLHKILKPFLLRRIKSEVIVELPPKKELLLYIPLSSMQRTLYKDLLARNVDAINDTGGRVRLLNLAMQLRKACNHPYLFEGYEDKSLDPFGEHLIIHSGKMLLLDRLLQRLIASNSRTLIFTQMTRMLDILEDYCRMRSFSYCRLDGSTSGEERERQLEEFNAPDSPHSIFLLSTRAGGLGINLATADTVVIFDSDWNPQVDLQAMDRAHRIGQKKPVNVYRLIHEHTMEEKIIERAMLKLRLDTAVIQHGRLSDRQQLNKGDLMKMVQFGADQIYKSKDAAALTEEDIEQILSRGEKRSKELSTRMETHLQKSLLDFDCSTANLYEFEGVDYNADRHAWAEMGVSALDEERNAKRRVRVVQEQFEELQRQQTLLAGGPPVDKKGRNKYLKLPRMDEWQFYNRDRISELHEIEIQYVVSKGLTEEPTFEEREEKQALLAEGFANWSRKDFLNFVRACETFGAANLSAVAREVGKSEADVSKYISVFTERFEELADGAKWLKKVKSGDDVNLKKQQMDEILIKKLSASGDPWRRLSCRFPKSKTQFTDEEDSWLLNATLAVGYGSWDQLQNAVNSDPTWTFDWFMRSRTSQDLGRRVEFLVRQIQRESLEETATRSKSKESNKMAVDPKFDRLYPPVTEMYKNTIVPLSLLGRGTTIRKYRKGSQAKKKGTSVDPSALVSTEKTEDDVNNEIKNLEIKDDDDDMSAINSVPLQPLSNDVPMEKEHHSVEGPSLTDALCSSF